MEKSYDVLLEFLEANAAYAAEGLNLIVEKILDTVKEPRCLKLLEAMSGAYEPLYVEDLKRITGLPADEVASGLSELGKYRVVDVSFKMYSMNPFGRNVLEVAKKDLNH